MSFAYRHTSSPIPPASPSSESSASSDDTARGESSSNLPINPSALIPDLRFEQSYIASIRSFIHELEPSQAHREKIAARKAEHEEGGSGWHIGGDPEDEDDEPRFVEARNPKGEPELWVGRLRVDWVPLLYVTMRDQILSPMVQGALWGVVGLFLGQARGSIRQYFVERRNRQQAGGRATRSQWKGTIR